MNSSATTAPTNDPDEASVQATRPPGEASKIGPRRASWAMLAIDSRAKASRSAWVG
ncbi:MAG: hypothetical protein QM804_13330 [Propionicimonas sp.]